MRNQKSKHYIMGNPQSKVLLECSFNQLPFTNKTSPPCSCWDHTRAKNFDYYFKREPTHISRKHYRCYQRGYIWGYNYVDIDYGEEKKDCQIEDSAEKDIFRSF